MLTLPEKNAQDWRRFKEQNAKLTQISSAYKKNLAIVQQTVRLNATNEAPHLAKNIKEVNESRTIFERECFALCREFSLFFSEKIACGNYLEIQFFFRAKIASSLPRS